MDRVSVTMVVPLQMEIHILTVMDTNNIHCANRLDMIKLLRNNSLELNNANNIKLCNFQKIIKNW